MLKKGNQLYLDIIIENEDGVPVDIKGIAKVLFTFKADDCIEGATVLKTYDDKSTDVTYENGKFRVWIKQEDTFMFKRNTSLDARVLYKNDVILGTDIKNIPTLESLSEVQLNA